MTDEERLELLSEIVRLDNNIVEAEKEIRGLKSGIHVAKMEVNELRLIFLIKYNNSVGHDVVRDMLEITKKVIGFVDYKQLLARIEND